MQDLLGRHSRCSLGYSADAGGIRHLLCGRIRRHGSGRLPSNVATAGPGGLWRTYEHPKGGSHASNGAVPCALPASSPCVTCRPVGDGVERDFGHVAPLPVQCLLPRCRDAKHPARVWDRRQPEDCGLLGAHARPLPRVSAHTLHCTGLNSMGAVQLAWILTYSQLYHS